MPIDLVRARQLAAVLLLVVAVAASIASVMLTASPARVPYAGRAAAPLPSLHPADATRPLDQPTHQTGMPPSSIRLPSLGVTGAVGVSRTHDGVLVPPVSATAVGRWPGSASLDARTGETTVVGHVSWPGLRDLTFSRLALLHPGDLVYTSDASGAQTAWRVTRVVARSKDEPVDAAAFAGAAGPRRLALITCGGKFDARARQYEANVYAFASPTPRQPGRPVPQPPSNRRG